MAAGAALALTACGSTARPLDGTAAPVSGGLDRSIGAPPATATSASDAGAASRAGTGTTTTTVAQSALPGSSTASQAPIGTTAQGPVPALGPGVTATTVNVGIVRLKDYNQTTQAAGLGNFTNDDQQAVVQAYIADINRHGGVLGRRLHPVYADYDSNSADTNSSQEQAICETWVQDNKVFAALAVSGNAGHVLDACLSKAHVIQVGSYAATTDATNARAFPLQYLPSGVGADRFAPAFVDGLGSAGWLSGKPVVALLSIESPVFHRAGARLDGLLRAHGSGLTDTEYVDLGDSNADGKKAIPVIQNAMLRFRGEGVTHVMVMADIADLYLVATLQAEDQHWQPKWGVASPSGAALLIGTAPDDQIAATTQVGWLPLLDRGFRTGTPTGPGYAHCIAVLKAAGIAPSSDQAAFNDAALCEQVYFLAAGLTAGGHADAESFDRGVAGMRDFAVATTYQAAFPGRHDGATTYRATAYKTDCSCFEFVTPARPI
jgi:hypothetical protein